MKPLLLDARRVLKQLQHDRSRVDFPYCAEWEHPKYWSKTLHYWNEKRR